VLFLATSLAVILMISMVFFPDDSSEYCNSLVRRAESDSVQTYLRNWTSENVSNRQFLINDPDVRGAGGMWPGNYWLANPKIDWAALELEYYPQVRLVGDLENVIAVFFGERSRYGFIVQNGQSETFGVEVPKLAWQFRDIAVVCWNTE